MSTAHTREAAPAINRLPIWLRPGLLCIGGAAQALSSESGWCPAAGVMTGLGGGPQ
jgi:hypothetical protein